MFIVLRISLFLLTVGVVLGQRSKGVEVRGEYQNLAGYAYRATVPDGVVAHRPATPAPSHGFVLDLATTDDHIWVDGHYNAAELADAHDALGPTLESISDRGSLLGEPRFQRTKFGGLPAVEVVVRYRDKKTNAERVCRSIAAIRRIKPADTMGIIYEVTLDSSAARFDANVATFDAAVRSFRLDPLKNY